MKVKVIDILNKIANGEEPPKVIKKQWKYEWRYNETIEEYTYMQETGERFDGDWFVINILNDEVEIIEEDKKIEKLDLFTLYEKDMEKKEILQTNFRDIKDKINEIIDYINKENK